MNVVKIDSKDVINAIYNAASANAVYFYNVKQWLWATFFLCMCILMLRLSAPTIASYQFVFGFMAMNVFISGCIYFIRVVPCQKRRKEANSSVLLFGLNSSKLTDKEFFTWFVPCLVKNGEVEYKNSRVIIADPSCLSDYR